MIECEIRSLISQADYNRLLEFFHENARFIDEDTQETYYLNVPHKQDLRIQKNNSYAKIWMKKGRIHDDAREEIEIKFDRNDFEKLTKLFKELGYGISIRWYRTRQTFQWNEITVCLDDTKNYGYIIELEILTVEKNREQSLQKIRQKLQLIHIQETPKEIFNKKFQEYQDKFQEK